MVKLAERMLTEPTPRVAAGVAVRIGGVTVDRIDASLPRALAGERGQVRAYVEAYRELTERVLTAVGETRPDYVHIDEHKRVAVVLEMKRPPQRRTTVAWVKAALEQEAMSIPFSVWVGTLGAGKGTAMAVVAALRGVLPGVAPLEALDAPRLPDWQLDERDVVRFSRAVLDELTRADAPLDHIAAVLGLTQTELGALFGVRRQAVDQWAARGVPAERQEKLATLGEIADLLAAKLKRDRIPGVVRRSAHAYGGRSMLDAIAAGDEELVLEELRDAFDWAAAA